MRIRFGYVAIARNILDGSPNRTITYTNLIKIPKQADRINCLRKLTEINLERLFRVLRYNKHHAIHVFRITSKLIPLATHPITKGWDYAEEFEKELTEIGKFIRESKMRISFHPDHFTLLNSPSEDILLSSIKALDYHMILLKSMDLDSQVKLVLHIGGVYQDKSAAIKRFIQNYDSLSPILRSRIILENDDKNFTGKETLDLCKKLKIPMVVDIHHHLCCNEGTHLADLWPEIINTWNGDLPKIHFSSPKDSKNIRAHADFIDPLEFYSFLRQVKNYNADFDVMLEAKQKDKALFQLIHTLKDQVEVKIVDETTIEF